MLNNLEEQITKLKADLHDVEENTEVFFRNCKKTTFKN
mgnify:CR=1 FL=1